MAEHPPYAEWQSLPQMLFDQAGRLADKPLLRARLEGAWQALTWRQVADRVRTLARGLRALGLEDGDRVVLVAENRPEWLIADMAVMAAGGITVPAYTTHTTDDHRYQLEHSGARMAIVSRPNLFKRLWPAAQQAVSVTDVIVMEDMQEPHVEAVSLHRWQDVMDRGAQAEDGIADRVAALRRDDVACIIYTSGTGGRPRGVMLTHGGILHNCEGAYRLLLTLGIGDEVFLSFLPLSHAYEHTAGQFFPLTCASQICYAEGLDALANNITEVRPTVMMVVPRFCEFLKQRLEREVRRRGGLTARLFDRAVALGRRRYEQGGRLAPWDAVQDLVLDRVVRRRVGERFGGRFKGMVSGGAALNPDVGLFFHALGIRLLQGYGQTESSPIVSCNLPNRPRMHTVGPPLHGVEVHIADDGEILVHGELVMKGYWNDEEATAAALADGWLHTGDIGRLEEDGVLVITDRKKDIIVTSGGENVSPARIESRLTLEPEVGQAMVTGDRRPYLVALLVPDLEFARDWARHHDRPRDLAALCEDEAFRKAVGAAVDRINRELAPPERVRSFILAAEPFTVDNTEMTPTMKIRRHAILARYGDRLNTLYGGG